MQTKIPESGNEHVLEVCALGEGLGESLGALGKDDLDFCCLLHGHRQLLSGNWPSQTSICCNRKNIYRISKM